MSAGTLKIGKDKFVVIREDEYRQMKADLEVSSGMLPDESVEQDLRDAAECRRRENEPEVSLEEVLKKLGL